jgi:tRNA(Ile)-lysidine synthase
LHLSLRFGQAMPAFSPEYLLERLVPFEDARRYWVAYSGGMDSEVLLHAATALCDRLTQEVCAAHVDHGLQPESARWAERCAARCSQLAVPMRMLRVEVPREPGKSLEAVAREARYRALAGLLEEGDLLLTAHHRGDQAETLLLNLLRGSGVRGLAAMPAAAPLGRGRLVRPLLDVRRAELAAYAHEHALDWIEDPTNRDLAPDRNFLRHRVLPLLAQRWPAVEASLARTAGHCAEAERVIAGAASDRMDAIAGRRAGTLSIAGLKGLDLPLQRAVLRLWLAARGFRLPDTRHLGRILDEVLVARPDAAPLVTWSGCEIRRYRDDLFALVPLPALPGDQRLPWRRGKLSLPSGLGELALVDAEGRELAPAVVWGPAVDVRFGVHGLACADPTRQRRRSLNRLFQDLGVPAWIRPFIPFIFTQDELVAVGDLTLCGSVGANRVGQLVLRWRGHPWADWLKAY